MNIYHLSDIILNYIDHLISYISGRLVEKIHSPVSGELYVYYVNGRYILNSARGNYSFGELHVAFRRIFRKLHIKNRNISNVLLLGLGGGSVVNLLTEEFKIKCRITAVDIDPVFIETAYKYFKIDRFENLKIVNSDAIDFLKEDRVQYDLVVFDIYIDNEVPSEFETTGFLKLLKNTIKPSGLLVFNKDVNSEKMKQSMDSFEKNFHEIFETYHRCQVVKEHYFFIYTPGR